MKLIRELLKENAADTGVTTTSSVATIRAPIMTSKRKTKMQKRNIKLFSEVLYESEFASKDVIAKLSNSQTSFNKDKNTTIIGLQDNDGNIIKIFIDASQVADFENTMNKMLSDYENKKEIAELVYDLKDLFNIYHIEWPDDAFYEDEEDTVDPDTIDDKEKDKNTTDTNDLSNELGDFDTDSSEAPDTANSSELESPNNDDANIKSLLDKVIQMFKIDAEARQADANARAKEAEAREAEWAARAAEAKIKSTEEIMKMEDHFRKQKAIKKEAEQIARMAQYKHETNKDEWENI